MPISREEVIQQTPLVLLLAAGQAIHSLPLLVLHPSLAHAGGNAAKSAHPQAF